MEARIEVSEDNADVLWDEGRVLLLFGLSGLHGVDDPKSFCFGAGTRSKKLVASVCSDFLPNTGSNN
jgi:hypothetical protein